VYGRTKTEGQDGTGANAEANAWPAGRNDQLKGTAMLLLADFTLGDLLVSMIALFFLILAVWLFIAVFADIFTRPDLSGSGKAGWVLLIFILPVIGVLIYLIARPPEVEVAARGILRRE
jgi:Phospholipase_D-nuclease N-terminal